MSFDPCTSSLCFFTPRSQHSIMNRAMTKHSRPSTVWLDESAFCNEQLSPNSTASPHTAKFEIGFHILHRETLPNPNAKPMVKLPSLNLARLQIISVRQNGNVRYLTRPIHLSVEIYVIRSLSNSNRLDRHHETNTYGTKSF
jgi:hypothetical protein